jgi:hypothetical protein
MEEKAAAAQVFYAVWKQAGTDDWYSAKKQEWKQDFG